MFHIKVVRLGGGHQMEVDLGLRIPSGPAGTNLEILNKKYTFLFLIQIVQ